MRKIWQLNSEFFRGWLKEENGRGRHAGLETTQKRWTTALGGPYIGQLLSRNDDFGIYSPEPLP